MRCRGHHLPDAEEHAKIDAHFAAMAYDDAYQAEARQIAAEFAQVDWEAWRESGAEA